MHYKLRVGLLALLSLLLILTGCASNNADVVATVNGKEITRAELDKQVNMTVEQYKQQGIDLTSKENKDMKAQLEKSVLDDLITKTLLMQEAERQKLTPSKEEVDRRIKDIKATFGKEEDFKKALAEVKMTEQDVREDITFRLTYQKLVDKVTADVKAPTEAEIAKYYNEHKDQFGTPERLEVKHILFAFDGKVPNAPKRTEAEALQAAKLALAEITQKGRDFAAVAREKSDDLGTRENGGSYTVDKGAGTTDPAFEKAAAALKPGEITKQPVKSAYGYHLIKLEKIEPATQKSLAEVKDQIAAQLESEAKQAKFSQFVDELKKKAEIDNRLAPKTGDSSKK
ncbi:PpiC-type peptidyl-prolyl cis-trans isomerase [Desulfotomaculum nigrificans CO-1-SRB]|uniref:peptidylprolyl isomerase n=1 Tax=Desulfotomaculum nigrificans (strain DSM 14880 / VKM B-2319 / CO-1-SRB) TaxID=868595 RepID=F6B4I1_DESCC|nr:SurA N-terminal domain-containing protein [Desulfotomaculum nigrificans]AEF93004.1 PpiC-type peptidyl-prolyl cis-trans isomerase [Desulfotomaculum nigrificans CO-1-SRB]